MSETAVERLRKWVARQPMTGASGGGNHTGLDLFHKALSEMASERDAENGRWMDELAKAREEGRKEGFRQAREMAAHGFANALARWHRVKDSPEMRGVTLAKFLADDIRAMQDEGAGEGKDVHTEHCCQRHGCKYGEAGCPVFTGRKAQSFPCADCAGEGQG